MRACRLAVVLFVVLVWVAGCGYQFTGGSRVLPGQIATIEIPIFHNATARAFLETVLTNHVRSRFARFSGAELVAEGGPAEGRLVGRIDAYEVRASAFDAQDNIIEYTATMRVNATLKRISDGKVLWKNRIDWNGTFPGGIDKNLQEVNQQQAIVEISEKIAEEILYRMYQDF